MDQDRTKSPVSPALQVDSLPAEPLNKRKDMNVTPKNVVRLCKIWLVKEKAATLQSMICHVHLANKNARFD